MWLDMHVTRREETKFRIPTAVTSQFRNDNDISESDFFTDGIVQEIQAQVADCNNQWEASKRQREREGSIFTTYSTAPAIKMRRFSK